MIIDKYTNVEDLHWYFISFSDGEKIGSIELGLASDVFVPSEIKKYIEMRNQIDYCSIINWKKINANQLSIDSMQEFKRMINDISR